MPLRSVTPAAAPPRGPIAILGAIPEELGAVIDDLDPVEVQEIAGRRFHRGWLHGHDVVLAVSRIGKVAAATTTTLLLERFAARAIVFTGVAGGVAPHLRIGDIVVADRLVHHDLDARPLFPRWEVPLLGVSRLPTDPAWVEMATRAAETAAHEDLRPQAEALGIDRPRVHRGLVVSGDQFVASAEALAALRTALPDALAVEMEGAAVAQVAYEYGTPCAIVRTISDTADHAASISFERFVAHAVGPYARAWVRRLLAEVGARGERSA